MSYCVNPICPQPQNTDAEQRCEACGSGLILHERYRAIKLLGQGGFGRTFLAWDQLAQDQSPVGDPALCVVKQFLPQNQTNADLRQSQELFQQESIRLKDLGDHPQIPALVDSFAIGELLYLVQEFVAGRNLAIVLAEQGAFSEAAILHLLNDLLPVLKFVHDRQVIHRDIKPANLIRREDDRLFLVDFGAAKLMTSIAALQQGTRIGSPEYVAPEQSRGQATFTSDLYSLGVTCVHLLTNVPPFSLFDGIHDRWVWQDYLPKPVSAQLRQILNKLLQNALNERFQSADEVLAAIGKTTGTRPTPAPRLPTWEGSQLVDGTTQIHALAFSPDAQSGSQVLTSGGDDKLIRLWECTSGKTIATLAGHIAAVRTLAYTGQLLASGSDDNTIRLWNIDGTEIATLTSHTSPVKSIAFSPDGTLLASGSWDKTIKLWEVATGKELLSLMAHRLQVTAVAFSADGTLLASASCDRTAQLWHLSTTPNLRLDRRFTFSEHLQPVGALTFNPSSTILATGSSDNTIKLWDVQTGQCLRTLTGHSWSVVALAFSPDGQTLVSGSWDKTLKLWRVATGEEMETLNGHQDSVNAVTIGSLTTTSQPSEWTIASGSKDKTIQLWQKKSGNHNL